jgi:hypothetical protein
MIGSMKLGDWYVQDFSGVSSFPTLLYFHAQTVQKNGKVAGVLVRVELDRPRARPKVLKSSVFDANLWKRIDDVPAHIVALAAGHQ